MRILLWFLIPVLFVGGLLIWLVSGPDERPPLPPQAPVVGTPETETRPEPAPPPEPPQPAVETPAPPEAVPEIIVDSFAPAEQISLGAWTRLEEVTGHFDSLKRLSNNRAVDPAVALSADEILVVQGWAGNYTLGLRFRDVLLSACGKIVARAQVSLSRPDVGKNVHPNLGNSGWWGQVLAGDLPSCADSALVAWSVVPGTQAVLAPLIGAHRYALADGADTQPRVSAQQVTDPFSYPAMPSTIVEVTASRANLRSCGSTSCDVVGQIDRGSYAAVLATRDAEWSLLLFPETAGWIFNELFQTAP